MPKGLLDTAREKVRGLLGDFPEGFNTGATVGLAGWPGDMVYMADTARRALTGVREQPLPQDYPGTTEALAAALGKPVPTSISGQLGLAVGGILSPSPGDLAKFAPVLSAIPFWHGSPHKYDAVDLSKIGTGEGAQAYGWGYYGADAQGTATEYKNALAGDALFTKDGRQIVPKPGTPADVALAHLASVPSDASNPFLIAERSVREVQKVATDANKPFFDDVVNALATLEAKGVQAGPGGYIYKGEYRWPDPAKEAATPLTGEDLLDWDKPLSEQSDSVKAALRRMPSAPDESVWPQWTGQQFYESEVRAGTDFDGIPKGDARRAHSKSLFDAGIPGIRYLDQMSRDGGEGTRNYVMFDETGIKLLERNGEAIEQFKAKRAGKAKPYKEAMGQ